MYRDSETRPPVTPQLALRVAVLGSFALAMFAIIFFRLWFLQVLSGDKYRAQANNNRIRDVAVPAPRGNILDRNGKVLVDNRVSIAVNTIIALPVYSVVRRLLLPLLPDDPRRRRRRAYTTGGLSPISRA